MKALLETCKYYTTIWKYVQIASPASQPASQPAQPASNTKTQENTHKLSPSVRKPQENRYFSTGINSARKVCQIEPSQHTAKNTRKTYENQNPQRIEKPEDPKKGSNRQSTRENTCKNCINITPIFFDKTRGKRKFWVLKWRTCRTTRENTCEMQSYNNLCKQTLKTLEKTRAKRNQDSSQLEKTLKTRAKSQFSWNKQRRHSKSSWKHVQIAIPRSPNRQLGEILETFVKKTQRIDKQIQKHWENT